MAEENEEQEEILATPEEMKAEALERMKLLGLFEPCIDRFRTTGAIQFSEGPLGGLYDLTEDTEPEIYKAYKDFEKDNGELVYTAIRNNSEEIGEVVSLLFVSKYKSEWPLDREDISDTKNLTPYVYAANLTYPECSETGRIGIRPVGGGLVRLY